MIALSTYSALNFIHFEVKVEIHISYLTSFETQKVTLECINIFPHITRDHDYLKILM